MAKKRYAYTMTENQMKDMRFFTPIIYFMVSVVFIYLVVSDRIENLLLSVLIALIVAGLFSFVMAKITIYLHDRQFKEIE